MLTFVRDLTPLHPILTDGDWAFDLSFCGASADAPMTFTEGTTFSAVFAPAGKRQPAGADVREITSGGGQIDLVDLYVVGLKLSPADLAGWTPGTYELELRAVYPDDGGTWPVYGAKVTVARGLSQAAELGGLAPAGLPGGQAGARAILTTAGERVVVYGDAAGQVSKAQELLAALHPQRMTAAFTAQPGVTYILGAGGYDVTLEPGHARDAQWYFEDADGVCGDNPVTLLHGAYTFWGQAEDFVIRDAFIAIRCRLNSETLQVWSV